MRMLRILFAVPALAAISPSSPGAEALKWESLKRSENAEISQKEVVATYSFTNQSDRPVRLTEVHPSCGCTVPTLDGDTYAPGATGSITATFTVGNRTGHQVKTIEVYTDEPGRKEPYTLTLEVDIPEAVKLSSRALIWRSGEEATPKECQITLHPDLPLAIDSVEPLAGGDEADFTVELIEVEPRSVYRVKVTPKAPGNSARLTLQLQNDSAQSDILKSYLIYAVVYPAAAN